MEEEEVLIDRGQAGRSQALAEALILSEQVNRQHWSHLNMYGRLERPWEARAGVGVASVSCFAATTHYVGGKEASKEHYRTIGHPPCGSGGFYHCRLIDYIFQSIV